MRVDNHAKRSSVKAKVVDEDEDDDEIAEELA